MARVVWSRRAIADLTAIRAYIHQSRPIAAMQMAIRLREAAESLKLHPHRGRLNGGLRELTAIAPYVIRYQITDETVEIVRIKHAAEDSGG